MNISDATRTLTFEDGEQKIISADEWNRFLASLPLRQGLTADDIHALPATAPLMPDVPIPPTSAGKP